MLRLGLIFDLEIKIDTITKNVFFAKIAQSAEHALGKGEVPGSIPGLGSKWLSQNLAKI